MEEYSDKLESVLQRMIDHHAWLVPEFARTLDCYDPAVLDALSIAMMLIPEHTTVDYWAKELGLKHRRELEGLFAQRGLPTPKMLFDWLRLARVVHYGANPPQRITRDDLAKLFRYPSGRYLARRARELTGQALGQVLAGGVEGLLQLISART